MMMEEEEETYFEEEQQSELKALLQGRQSHMHCPVCNYLNPNGFRCNGVAALLMHSRSKKSKDKAETRGHRDQAAYIEAYLQESEQTNGNGVGKSDLQNQRQNGSSNEQGSSGVASSSRSSSQPNRSTTRKEREMDIEEGERVSKQLACDRPFGKREQQEVWPPIILVQGIIAIQKNDVSGWSPTEIKNERLQQILVEDLEVAKEYLPKSAKLVYGKMGLALHPDARLLRVRDKQYGLGMGVAQLKDDQLSLMVVADFYRKVDKSNRGKQGWQQFLTQDWNSLCIESDNKYVPRQGNTLHAFNATPEDVRDLLPREYWKYIVQKDVSRKQTNELKEKYVKEQTEKRQINRRASEMEQEFSDKLQQKTMECLTLAETMAQIEQQREEMRKNAEMRELENARIEEDYRQQQEEMQFMKQKQELSLKAHQERIAEMQRERNSMRTTHEAQVGHLTSKLQCLQLESKEDMQLRKELQQQQDLVSQKEMELQNMNLKVELMQNEVKEKDLEKQEKSEALEQLTREFNELVAAGQGSDNDKLKQLRAEIDKKMMAMGFKFSLEDLQNMTMECQCCFETFLEYQTEPLWHTMPEFRFDIEARKKAKDRWKQEVQTRFFVRLECDFGCSGLCLGCADKLWVEKGYHAKKFGQATRKCPYCRTQWKVKPKPYIQHLKSFV